MERVIVYDREKRENAAILYNQTCDVVACLLDEYVQPDAQLQGVPQIGFEDINTYSFDRVLIMQHDEFDRVKDRLRKLGIEDDRIVFGGSYLNIRPTWVLHGLMFSDMEENGYNAITDLGFQFANENFFNGPADGVPKDRIHTVRIYGCMMEDEVPMPDPVFCNLYEECYMEIQDIPERVRRQCLYLGNIERYMKPDSAIEFILMFLDVFDVVYYCVPFPDTMEHCAWNVIKRIPGIQIYEWKTGHGDVLVRIRKAQDNAQVKIYVACHNAPPEYQSDTYVPIWLGKAENNKYGFAGTDLEQEIAAMNPRINECTGLYWIWKHSDADIKGMAHYRRFYRSEMDPQKPILERDEILRLLTHYDIVLTRLFSPIFPVTIHFANSLQKEIREHGMRVFEKWISERQPDYVQAFHKVMYGNSLYLCQMLIARREVFDRYCEWLFSFLLDAAEELDYDSYKDANHRVSAYMAECMLTVWLMKQPLMIKEVPLLYTG